MKLTRGALPIRKCPGNIPGEYSQEIFPGNIPREHSPGIFPGEYFWGKFPRNIPGEYSQGLLHKYIPSRRGSHDLPCRPFKRRSANIKGKTQQGTTAKGTLSASARSGLQEYRPLVRSIGSMDIMCQISDK